MKKLLILSLALMLFTTGCGFTSENNQQSTAEETTIIAQKSSIEGKIKETYIENDKKYIEIVSGENTLKLDATNVKDFETIKADETFRIEYENDSKAIVDLTRLNEQSASTPSPSERNKRIIHIEPNLNIDGLNPYKTADISGFPEFGIPKVILYTDAAVDEKGIFHWDDGNRFVLVAHTADSGYVLFDERVQLGGMDVNIYSLENVLYIAAMDTATADLNFRIFELINGSFEEDLIFDGQGNINMLYHSL